MAACAGQPVAACGLSARSVKLAATCVHGGESPCPLLNAAGRRRSPATLPGHLAGRPPRNKGAALPARPPPVEEIVAVMRAAGDDSHGARMRALIVLLWRAGLRINEALTLTEHDLDARLGAILVRHGNLGSVGEDISEGADQIVVWLRDNNAWVEQHEDAIRDFLKGILPAAKDAAGGVLTGVLGGLSFAAQLVSGALLMFVFLLYVVTGGDAIWGWIQDRFGASRRERVGVVGVTAWNAASGYIRGIALVALIDTTVITIGMLVIGTPHVGTLALLTFVSLFIPILGAWVSGAVTVLVTLASVGTDAAVAMAAVILIAQQLDSMFVTPLVYQKTVNLHPIVTLTAVIVGSQLLGIVGAFLAVPMVAVGWAVYNALEQPGPKPTGPADPGLAAAGPGRKNRPHPPPSTGIRSPHRGHGDAGSRGSGSSPRFAGGRVAASLRA
jgi:putative heme transporter